LKKAEDAPLLTILHGNRCESYLQIREYQLAYEDSVKALEYSPEN